MLGFPTCFALASLAGVLGFLTAAFLAAGKNADELLKTPPRSLPKVEAALAFAASREYGPAADAADEYGALFGRELVLGDSTIIESDDINSPYVPGTAWRWRSIRR